MIGYRARWLFTGDRPPLANATIQIEQGRVVDVGTDPRGAIDLGNVAIIPGLINAHTHLEFSSIQAPLEPLRDFAAWIQAVIGYRQTTDTTIEKSVANGLVECRTSGTTTIAEIATTDWRQSANLQNSNAMPAKTVIFREYLGLADAVVAPHLADAERFVATQSSDETVVGLSPHAPYSLHPELFNGLCQLAQKYQAPLAMHLAESDAELELLATGGGPLAEMLVDIGVFRHELFSQPQRPLDFLKRLDCGVPVLVVHGNLLNDEEIQFIADRPNFAVVYCPRTHSAMQTSIHPWQKMLQAGVTVALGTDSRASNPDLSIWKELCFLKNLHPQITTSDFLKLATQSAAKALNLPGQGILKENYAANLCVVQLDDLAEQDPEQSLLLGNLSPQGVMIDGEWRVKPDILTESLSQG